MALKVTVGIRGVRCTETVLTIETVIYVVGHYQLSYDFSGALSAIANVGAIVPYLKGQVTTFVQNTFSMTVVDAEIAIFGAPL